MNKKVPRVALIKKPILLTSFFSSITFGSFFLTIKTQDVSNMVQTSILFYIFLRKSECWNW
jgi:hypothetical protein